MPYCCCSRAEEAQKKMTSEQDVDPRTQFLLLEGSDIDYYTVIQLYDVFKARWLSASIYADLLWHCSIPFDHKIYLMDVQFDVCKDTYGIRIHTTRFSSKRHDHEINVIEVPTSSYAGYPVGVYKRYIYFSDNRRINRLNGDDNTFEENVFFFAENHTDSDIIIANGMLYNIGSFHRDDEKSFCEKCDLETLEVAPMAPLPVTSASWEPDEWKHRPTLHRVSVTELNGKLYAMDVRTLKYMYVYSPEKDEWETTKFDYPPLFIRAQLTSCGGKLVCVDSTRAVHVHDPETNRWERRERYGGYVMARLNRVFTVHIPESTESGDEDDDDDDENEDENEQNDNDNDEND